MVCMLPGPPKPLRPSMAAKRAMSSKRKALATADTNTPVEAPVSKKAKGPHRTKASVGNSRAPPARVPNVTGRRTMVHAGVPRKADAKTFKYSSAESLEKELPKICCICWPTDSDDEDEDDEDEHPKPATEDEEEEPSPEVTAKGYPITEAGLDKFMYINIEQAKRDPDNHNMYIYNDFAGYGTTEVLENLLADFHKDLFKKDISPLKKWSYIEGLITWLKIGDLYSLISNDNSEAVKEVFDMFIPMLVTAIEMIAEHDLFSSDKPIIQNQGIMCLLLLEFLQETACDFDVKDTCEIVRAAKKFGINLEIKPEYNMTETLQVILEELREECEEKPSGLKAWKTLYPSFKREHPGGKKYDITKMSKAERKEHEF